MAYTPVELEKGATRRVAKSYGEEARLRWDGWLPTGTPVVIPAFDDKVRDLVADKTSATAAELRAALGSADPVLSDFVYDPVTGNLLSYKEDGIPVVLTYNSDQTVATMKRGDAPTKSFTYSGGNLAGVA